MSPTPMTPTLKLILRDLKFGSAIPDDLAEHLGLTKDHVRRLMRRAAKAGLMLQVGWEGRGQHALPVYARSGPKAGPRPAPLTKAEVARRCKARKRASHALHHDANPPVP